MMVNNWFTPPALSMTIACLITAIDWKLNRKDNPQSRPFEIDRTDDSDMSAGLVSCVAARSALMIASPGLFDRACASHLAVSV